MHGRSRLLLFAVALSIVCSFSARPAAGSQAVQLPESKGSREEPAPKISAKATPEQDRAIERRLEEIFSELEGAEGVRVTVRSGVVSLTGEVLSQNMREQAVKLARLFILPHGLSVGRPPFFLPGLAPVLVRYGRSRRAGFPLEFLSLPRPSSPLVGDALPIHSPGSGACRRLEPLRMVSSDHTNSAGFRHHPSFHHPLMIAGETVRLEHAGVGYAFLMALANVTDMFEGAIGTLLYQLMSQPAMRWLIEAFYGSLFDIAGVNDERTLILQIFVYVSLIFTLLTLPLIALLRREFARRGISIQLAGSDTSAPSTPHASVRRSL